VSIYNILGRKVRTLHHEWMSVGFYSQFVGKNLKSGVYFAIISKPDDRRVFKFAVIR